MLVKHLSSDACDNEHSNLNEAGEAGNNVKAVEVIPVTPLDKFCSNAEFEENLLIEENSVMYRVIGPYSI